MQNVLASWCQLEWQDELTHSISIDTCQVSSSATATVPTKQTNCPRCYTTYDCNLFICFLPVHNIYKWWYIDPSSACRSQHDDQPPQEAATSNSN